MTTKCTPEKLAAVRAYYRANRQEILKKKARWKKENRDKRSEQGKRRTQRRKLADPVAFREMVKCLKDLPINPDSERARRRRKEQRQRDELRDKYLASLIGLPLRLCTREMLEDKRRSVLRHRELRGAPPHRGSSSGTPPIERDKPAEFS